MVSPTSQAERWGDFVLAQDRAQVVNVVEHAGPRQDFKTSQHGSIFAEPGMIHGTSEADARRHPDVPVLGVIPAAEEFQGFHLLRDSRGLIEVCTTYIRPNLRLVTLTSPAGKIERPALPDDATIQIARSLRFSRPLYVTPLRTADEERRDTRIPGSAVVLEETKQITVRGKKGIARIYACRDGGDTYRIRIPSVAITWFDGSELWAFHSHFLSLPQAIEASESITLR